MRPLPRLHQAVGIDPAAYQRHPLHDGSRAWNESNCYVDLLIEVVHGLGLDPCALLPFTLAGEFEGDQWTFVKPSPHDLEQLYGLQISELNLWRPALLTHAVEQVSRGRLVLAEVDAFFLPDTAGTDYRRAHTKTTVALESIDPATRQLGYFHNAGYFWLEGEDFAGLFRLGNAGLGADGHGTDALGTAGFGLPPYVELLKRERQVRLSDAELTARSLELLRQYLGRTAPAAVAAMSSWYLAEVVRIKAAGGGAYHPFAFATVRQLGASAELFAHYLRWLAARGITGAAQLASPFDQVSDRAKSLLLKTARAVAVEREVPLEPLLRDISEAWASGLSGVKVRFGA